MTLRLTELTIYPLKSARGIPATEWEVDDFGLALDRRWMVADRTGELISQRTHPRMALVVPSLNGGSLRLDAPGMPTLELPPDPPATVVTTVTVWDDRCVATWLGPRASEWISDYLGDSASLMYMDRTTHRPADARYAPEGTRVSFADGFPFLLISELSLADLNRRLETPLPMNRFRPNLVIGGGQPYQEDGWTAIQVGDIPMRVVKPCARCVVTTTDQVTTERAREPLRTLARYRNVNGKALFGQNAVHHSRGLLRVGDRVVADPPWRNPSGGSS